MAYLAAGVGGVVFFVLSVALLGIWPGRVLEEQTRAMGPERVVPLTPSEIRGRTIYGREGCAYCHTQQVRFVDADIVRFGAPTLAWETRLDYPHLWGTRRIGPDLARATGTRSEDWHFAHLFAPRSVVADSVMPAYPALFDGSARRPRQAARDLVAYLESLGRARELAGPEGEARARAACQCDDDEMRAMAFHAPEVNASPARTRRGVEYPTLFESTDLARGRTAYAANCASCHGPDGRGDGPAAESLRPRPANLAAHEYSRARLTEVLWNGIPGTAMQAWRDQAPADLAAMVAAVRQMSRVRPDPPAAPDVLAAGREAYDANCAQCHGATGGGDGSAARQQRVPPTNFREQRASLDATLRALTHGVEGTSMAPWPPRLDDTTLRAVALYVQRFYQPEAAR
jgi:cytochrome c oxidase cbb3-type subunit 2/cytochrome c oxidase cbb3-type subunit I/II